MRGETERIVKIDVRLEERKDSAEERVVGLWGLLLGCRHLGRERKCESMGYWMS